MVKSTQEPVPELTMAWHIIDSLLKGMLISDPRWSVAAAWLQRNYSAKADNCPKCKGWPYADVEIGAGPCALCTTHAPR